MRTHRFLLKTFSACFVSALSNLPGLAMAQQQPIEQPQIIPQFSHQEILTEPLKAQIIEMANQRALNSVPKNSKIEIKLGSVDSRFKLSPCEKVEPYFPPATPSWGRMRMGLKCVEGEKKWNINIPLTVEVTTKAIAASSQLAVGTVLEKSHLKEVEVNLSKFNTPPILDPNAVIGRILARPQKEDSALHMFDIKMKTFFAAGDVVKIVTNYNNLQVTVSGIAVTAGVEGQPVRVKTDSGKLLQGKATGPGTVEVNI